MIDFTLFSPPPAIRPLSLTRCVWPLVILLLLDATLSAAGPPTSISETGLHLVQQFEVAVAGQPPALKEHHDLYVYGDKLALHSPKSWLLIRRDLQTAWVMDEHRTLLSQLPVSQLGDRAAAAAKAMPQHPAFRASGESKTIAGLSCRIYRGALKGIAVEACMTQELTALDRFQALITGHPDVPGVALEFIVNVQQAGKERVTFTQRVIRVTRGPIDQALFSPPPAQPVNR